MARAFPQSPASEYGQDPRPGEWQALRGELVALLDQVEGQVARVHRYDDGYQGLSERVRDLRFQVSEHDHDAPQDRHREALRTVQRAVDRFSDRDEPAPLPAPPRDSLQSAINQIRARHLVTPAPRLPPQVAQMPDSSLFGELAQAVAGISQRLERLETELKTQALNTGNVKDIADQVAQLTHVVELLAGAVGETGQVKRLEGQIAKLAEIVSKGPQVDLSALASRLDDVSSTVGRLADLQVLYAGRVENPVQSAAFKDGMQAIEAGIRNVYDRIDSIERTAGVSPTDIDHLTSEMGRFIEAIRSNATPPQNLIALLDALNGRVSEIESQEGAIGSLKADVHALRATVIAAVEPRFDAIETQIGALGKRFDDLSADTAIGQLEAQVRLLVARMDQTGAQLSGLAKLYGNAPEPLPPLDMEALADLVAARTSEAMTRSEAPTCAVGDSPALNELEVRMATLFTESDPPEADERPVQQSAPGGVDERLARLEASLRGTRDGEQVVQTSPPNSHAQPTTLPDPYLAATDATEAPAPTAESVDSSMSVVRSDAMPRNPDEDAPLTAPPFPEAGPVHIALQAKNGPRKHHPGLTDPTPGAAHLDAISSFVNAAASTPAAITHDRTHLERPPAPQSSFDMPEQPAFAMPDATIPDAPPQVSAPISAARTRRNTFIEAARRAARQQTPEAPVSNSLIGRALARFQTSVSEVHTAEKKSKPAKERRPGKQAHGAAAHPEQEPAPIVMPERQTEPEPTPAIAIDAAATQDGADAHRESFLSRNSKPILLAASVVALALLTYNLVLERTLPADPELAPPTDATPGTPAASLDNAAAQSDPDAGPARVIPMADSLATGSIDPSAARGFTATISTQDMPPTFKPVTGETERAPPPLSGTGPVPLELPPETIGPVELRQAAANGDARAQFEVAAIYTEGRAVPQDLAAATAWYERSAAQGFAPAQYRLGNLYETGTGMPKNLEQARLWYERAAEAGNRLSMHNLAALHAGGQLGKQQFDTAAKWFEEAAARGMTDSQFNLGMLYARGLGVPQNMDASYKWFSLAALSGDKDAAKSRDDVARSLDAETVKRLAAEIAAWRPAPIDLAANFAPIGTWSDTFDPGEAISSRDIVASVQGVLNKLGFDVGTPDGILGAKTTEAIRRFERATGMSEVGTINPRLLAVLGSQPV